MNLERPNAKQNTIVIACIPAKGLHKNLAKLTAIYHDLYFCLGTVWGLCLLVKDILPVGCKRKILLSVVSSQS